MAFKATQGLLLSQMIQIAQCKPKACGNCAVFGSKVLGSSRATPSNGGVSGVVITGIKPGLGTLEYVLILLLSSQI